MARPLLAAIFISGGINALRNAEGHAQAAKPFLDRTVRAKADALPASVPTDPVSLVKLDAAVKIGAGTALAFGKLPRLSALLLLGSLVPTTAASHAFWEEKDEARKQEQLIHFLKNAGLAGGLLLAAGDTGGRPSLGWRARRAARKAGKRVHDTREAALETVHDTRVRAGTKAGMLAGRASKTLESALPH
ncbi:DoxX family membrane protein [Amycolatopsis arida]|uniref:DoxX family membrane protein n=1 Tax=Amycolatopsis arida TaxID=587909 RepID=UPI001FD0B0B2|nr:DoxX family membrane protein [Amycolatopsis arida]